MLVYIARCLIESASELNVLSECNESKGPMCCGHVNYWVYIVRCSDGSYYVGHTADIDARIAAHNAGDGARWTAARRPVRLAYQESHPSQEVAVRRETQLKKWSRAKKEALIDGNLPLLQEL